MKQGQIGSQYGNISVQVTRTKAVNVSAADFIWQTGFTTPFVLILEEAANLVVQLIGETAAEKKLTPFQAGENSKRVQKVFFDVTNTSDGTDQIILAGI